MRAAHDARVEVRRDPADVLAEEQGPLRRVRSTPAVDLGNRPLLVTLHAEVLIDVGDVDREAKLALVRRVVRVMTYGADDRKGLGAVLLDVVRVDP